jgi:cupin 2 domain-containing protein
LRPIFGNLFDSLPPASLEEEVFETLAEVAGARIERIVSSGQRSPEGFWYDQGRDELVVLLEGSAALEIEGEGPPVEMRPGAWALIPAGCRHRVARTASDQPTVWLAVHLREPESG